MNKIKLLDSEVRELVGENRYKVVKENRFLSRCIDGRYKNDDNLPAQAFPGADLGELALILGTARAYALEIDREKAFKCLTEIINGEKNFSFHSDSHGDPGKLASGCGHFKQINKDLSSYKLEQSDLDFMYEKLKQVKAKGAPEVVLEGDHLEGAILLLRGSWGVYPQYNLETEQGTKQTQIFVYHQSLTDEKHKLLAKKMVETEAVKFKLGEDEDYLYQVLSDTAEFQLMETVKRLAPDLDIFSVKFEFDGSFKIVKT